MQIRPTQPAIDLAVAGIGVVAVGTVTAQASIVAWGGALLLGLAIARAVTHLGVSRIRSAGFEMLWRGEGRVRQVVRGQTFEIEAEVRNRDTRAARYVALRPVCSPYLNCELEPESGEVPASGRLKVSLRVSAPRVGRHGIHGLSLEVVGSPGLFEVPLTFANPYGVEVLPSPFGHGQRSARGGRSRRELANGRAQPVRGQGSDLRELREHQFGDPLKHIAWKASARRGVLMVRQFEREERDVIWLLLDASVELWSGVVGRAPLDVAIDDVAKLADRHLRRGDAVGLGIVARRRLTWLPPKATQKQHAAIISALTLDTGCLDSDRSDLDEADLSARVLEHMLPLDPQAALRLRANELERVARRAERVGARGPFPATPAFSYHHRERALRGYFAAFGLAAPHRLEPDRPRTDETLADALGKVLHTKPRASVVHVWSPVKDMAARATLLDALKHPRRHVELRWHPVSEASGIADMSGRLGREAADAVRLRVAAAEIRGGVALRRHGVRTE